MMARKDFSPIPLSISTVSQNVCQFVNFAYTFRQFLRAISFFFARQRQRGLLFIDIAWETRVWIEAFHHNNVIWCLCPCVLSSTCGRLPLALPWLFAKSLCPQKYASFRCYLPWFCQLSLMVIWYFTVDNGQARTKLFTYRTLFVPDHYGGLMCVCVCVCISFCFLLRFWIT